MLNPPSTVLVDRLSHALASQGVKLKRRALLEAASYTFGFRSSNAFTAASAAGDITPPPVTVIGRLELPGEQALIVVTDPLANAPYAIDESFIEHQVEQERREQIGVSPYGHLVDLSDVASAPAAELFSSTTAKPVPYPGDDADVITIGRDDLARLLEAAKTHHEEISTGIDEGIYDANDNTELDDLQASIDVIDARLELPVLPAQEVVVPTDTGKLAIYVARVVHKQGSDIFADLSPAGRDAQLSNYCRENWHEVADLEGIPENFAGMSDHEIVTFYFDALQEEEREWVEEEIIQLDLPAPGLPVHRSESPAGAGYEDLAAILESGSVADVWYDAHEYSTDAEDDPDRIAEEKIETIKNAMVKAAEVLRSLPEAAYGAPTQEPATTCVRCDTKLRTNGLCADETCGFSGLRQDSKAGWAGHPDAAEMIAANKLSPPIVITDSDGYGAGSGTSLNERETQYALHGITLNSHLEHPFKIGTTVLHANQIWLAALTDIGWDIGEENGYINAMSNAVAFMQHLDPLISKLGGWTELKPGACEFSHEFNVYLPMSLALESQAPEDWKAGLAYILMTANEKQQVAQVTCEYTAEVDANRMIISADPLGDTTWDGTFDALRWGTDAAIKILTGEGDPDDYAHSPLAPDWVGEWSSARPFTVQPIGLQEALKIAL